jgi:HK97 family phage prohead protease
MKEVRIAGSLRAAAGMPTKSLRISGLAARYELPTVIHESATRAYREIIARGAFRRAVADKHDARLYVNHDRNRIMGRVKAGTLRLRDTAAGLEFDADLPDTEDGRSVYTAIQRGDMNECSFGFENPQENWTTETVNGVRLGSRTITDIGHLADVSIVANPAYSGTSVQARAAQMRFAGMPDFVLEMLDDDEESQLRRKELLRAILL